MGRTVALETGSNGRPLQLVQVLLEAEHTAVLTSRGTPVFVIKNKLKKWRMLTDLRAVSRVFQPGSPLQPGIPLPSSLPVAWPVIIKLKDYFLTIPLQEQDKEKLPSHVPTYNNVQPVKAISGNFFHKEC